MRSSTVVTRTEAGEAELALPAHGLSLTQRRFLTLLDTSCTFSDLAVRHPAGAEKLERDVSRLADLGLVVCDAPANDPLAHGADDAIENGSRENDLAPAGSEPAVQHTRPARTSRVRRIAFMVAPIAAVIAAWIFWQTSSTPVTESKSRAGGSQAAKSVGAATQPTDLDVTPIATRVLRGDPERPRDMSKDGRAATKAFDTHREAARTAHDGDARTASPMSDAKLSPKLPVEHRTPSAEDFAGAPAPVAPEPSKAGEPTPSVEQPAPMSVTSKAADPTPSAAQPAPVSDTSKAAEPRSTVQPTPLSVPPRTPETGLRTSPPEAATAPGSVAPAQAAESSVRVASLAPPVGALHAVPTVSAALVPITRESPAFPHEAIVVGLTRGEVRARLAIDAMGNVTDVTIVEASHRAFNRAVREALARWRFEPGAPNRTTTVDIAFTRD